MGGREFHARAVGGVSRTDRNGGRAVHHRYAVRAERAAAGGRTNCTGRCPAREHSEDRFEIDRASSSHDFLDSLVSRLSEPLELCVTRVRGTKCVFHLFETETRGSPREQADALERRLYRRERRDIRRRVRVTVLRAASGTTIRTSSTRPAITPRPGGVNVSVWY